MNKTKVISILLITMLLLFGCNDHKTIENINNIEIVKNKTVVWGKIIETMVVANTNYSGLRDCTDLIFYILVSADNRLLVFSGSGYLMGEIWRQSKNCQSDNRNALFYKCDKGYFAEINNYIIWAR